MADFEPPKEDYGHPDSAIRLASCVHRFRVPKMNPNRNVSFARAFKTMGSHPKTRKIMIKAGQERQKLNNAVTSDKVSHERVVADAKRYQPLISQILLTCKVQPELAQLDERLIFEWNSGVENDQKKFFKSEAIMFDLVMSMLAEGLGKAGVATEASMAGEFAIASREYAAAAGIFDFLSKDQLPKWISRGSKIDADQLPIECSLGIASALKILFQANGQQMAVATVLIKSGTPNYSLVAKLCFGIAEQLEAFVAAVREDSFKQMARMDKDFFTLITFQTQIHRSLSQYFHARSLWEQQGEYGTAIAILHDAMEAIQVRSSAAGKGIPDANSTRALIPLGADIKKLREHMKKLLRYWEKDNSSVYFERVPHHVPEEKKLQAGIQMKKMEKYKLADAEPLLLAFPEGTEGQMERSDSDLMKELQALEIEELEKELAGM